MLLLLFSLLLLLLLFELLFFFNLRPPPPPTFTQTQSLIATSAIAQKMTKQFSPYYSLFSPRLKTFLDVFFPRGGVERGGRGGEEERDRRRVWGRSIECLTIMGGEGGWGEKGEEDVSFVLGLLERSPLGWEDEEVYIYIYLYIY